MKKIALINDLSGFGKCSLTAAISVVSVMGIHAVPLPTAVLSAQTGFQSFYCDDYTDRMDFFTEEWKKMNVHFDGIHSGYLAGSEQIKKVMHLLDAFQTKDTVYLADPVMGDNGRQFKAFSKELLDGMKQLCARASITTPNLTELCLLTGTDYETLTAFSKDDDYLRYRKKTFADNAVEYLFARDRNYPPVARRRFYGKHGSHRRPFFLPRNTVHSAKFFRHRRPICRGYLRILSKRSYRRGSRKKSHIFFKACD